MVHQESRFYQQTLKVFFVSLVLGLFSFDARASGSPSSNVEDDSLPSFVRDLRSSNSSVKYQPGSFPGSYDDLSHIGMTPFYEGRAGKPEQDISSASIGIPGTKIEDGKCVVTDSGSPIEHKKPQRDIERRQRITATDSWPYGIHGHLLMTFAGNKIYTASGVLVGPHHVLTAAHNLYNPRNKQWATEVFFAPGRDEDSYPYGDSKGCVLLVHEKWQKSKTPQTNYDLGMVILDWDIGLYTGWSGLLSLPDDLLMHAPVSVTGYPGEKGRGIYYSTQMWTLSDQIKMIQKEKLFYEIQTSEGQSGSGVWGERWPGCGDGIYTVGIHTGKEKTDDPDNRGVRLSKEKFTLVLQWLKTYQLLNSDLPELKSCHGHPRSLDLHFLDELGGFYDQKPSLEHLVRRAKEEGDGQALYHLACFYAEGEENPKDPQKAFTCFYLSAQKKHVSAFQPLGICYEEGKGTEKNLLKALSFYFQAHNQDHGEATRLLGLLFLRGRIVSKKPETALRFLEEAHKNGDAEACYHLSKLYEDGNHVTQDLARAQVLYKQAQDRGYGLPADTQNFIKPPFKKEKPEQSVGIWEDEDNKKSLDNIGLSDEEDLPSIEEIPEELDTRGRQNGVEDTPLAREGHPSLSGLKKQDSSYVEMSRWFLEERVVQALEGEEDGVTPSLESVYGFLQNQSDPAVQDLKARLTPRSGCLGTRWQAFHPENFLAETRFNKTDRDHFLRGEKPTPAHPFLAPLQTLIRELKGLDHGAAQNLGDFYGAYITALSQIPQGCRERFLAPKLLMTFETGRGYRISQEKGFLGSNRIQGDVLLEGEGTPVVFSYTRLEGQGFHSLLPLSLLAGELSWCPLSAPSLVFTVHNLSPQDRHPQTFYGFERSPGESVIPFLEKTVPFDAEAFDRHHFGLQVVLSLLYASLYPLDDGKANPFTLHPSSQGYRFVRTPSEKLLGDSDGSQKGEHYLPGTFLYGLPLMNSVFPEDFKKLITDLPVTLPWGFLTSLLEQRQRYHQFVEQQFTAQQAIADVHPYERAFLLKPEDFVRMIHTWHKIQEALQNPRVMTFQDLVDAADALTGGFYGKLRDTYKTPLQDIQALYDTDTLDLPSKEDLSILAESTQCILPGEVDQGQRLEEIFLAGWQDPSLNTYGLCDILRFSQDLTRIKKSLPEGSWTALVHKLKESWPQGLWSNDTLPFQLFKELTLSSEVAMLWCQEFLPKISFKDSDGKISIKDDDGNTLLHLLLKTLSPVELSRFDYTLLKGLLNIPDGEGLTPLDVGVQDQKPVEIIKALCEVGAYAVNDPKEMAAYIKRRGCRENTFTPWVPYLMNRVPQLKWHIMLEEVLPPIERKVPGRTVTSAHFGQRTFPTEIEQRLFEADGTFKKANKSGRRTLGYVPWRGGPGGWLKILPELPGREETARRLCLDVLVKGSLPRPLLPPSTLLNIPCEGPWEVFKKKNLSCVSVLISQDLGKQNFHEALRDDPMCYKNLDSESLGWLFVLSLLLNPEDGQPANYVIRPHPLKGGKLILSSVDNDHIFVPSVALEKRSGPFGIRKSRTLQVKTILYCLDQMNERLDPSLVKALLSINAEERLTQWLKGLQDYEKRLGGLFTSQECNALYNNDSMMFMPFAKGEMPELYRKFVRLQDVLASRPASSFLEILLKVDPLLGKRYSVVHKNPLSPLECFQELDGIFYSVALNGSYQSLMTGRQTLEHFIGAVVTCKDFLTLIKTRQDLSVAQALDDLQVYVQKEKSLLNLGEGVGYGGTDPKLIEVYLQKRSWETIPQATQRHLLSHMLNKTFRTLYLRNATRLRWNDFKTFGLTQLTFLDVSGCPFVGDDFIDYISKNCFVLNTFDVSRTQITGIKSRGRRIKEQGRNKIYAFQGPFLTTLKAIECFDLKTLIIEAPNLLCIDIPSLGLPSINLADPVLDLSDRRMLASDLLRLCSFKNITNITSLDLGNNHIGKTGAESLRSLTGLTFLDLRRNYISATGAESLRSLTGLTFLDLRSNLIGETGAASLSTLTGLTSLDLGHNWISDNGSASLSTLTNLTFLDLRSNVIGEIEAESLSTLTGLTSLNLMGSRIRDIGAASLKTLTGLTSLDLRDNKIGPWGAAYLSTLTGLTSLDLSGNDIGEIGAKSLSTLTGLVSLDLSWNTICDTGAESLSTLTGLTSLDLGRNHIYDTGAESLSTLTGLTSLDLGSNYIAATGVSSLRTLTGLMSLNLETNNIDPEGTASLSALMSLTSLNLRGNSISEEAQNTLCKKLPHLKDKSF